MSLRTTATMRAAGAAVLVLTLGACSAESGASSGAAAPSSEAAEASEAAAPSSAAASAAASSAPSSAAGEASVLVADSDLGEILTDPEGMVIYFFANDTEGTSNCEGDCLANWPPVEAEGSPTAGDGVTAELGTIERSDGSTQLTVNEFPAYYFAADEAPGDTNGQGVGDVWWVFGTDGEPIEE